MRRHAALLAGALLLAGCGGIGDDEGRAFVDAVRSTLPSAESYPDDQLLTMAEKACGAGSRRAAVPLLQGYGGLTDLDRRRIAGLALDNACPAD